MIKRERYLSKIRPFYESELIKVLMGIRRCGKSVLMQQIMAELEVDPKQIIYMNFEDFALSDVDNAQKLHETIMAQTKKKQRYYLFFDEIQYVAEWERAINSFRVTLDCDIYLTGSNSNLLHGDLATLLSGRYISFQIHPFSFSEVCEFNGLTDSQINQDTFFDYMKWGGMPQQLMFTTEAEKRALLQDLYNSIVLNDIIAVNKVADVALLNRIIEYVAATPAQTFSVKSIANYFESQSVKISTQTLYNYLGYVTDAMFVSRAKQYDIRGKRTLLRNDKLYLEDLGFSTLVNTGMRIEIGALLENIVHNELVSRGYQVYVGKTAGGEIDFIATREGQKSYYQVAYLMPTEDVMAREFGAYQDVTDNFPKYVLSLDPADLSRDGIIHQNLIDFLLEE